VTGIIFWLHWQFSTGCSLSWLSTYSKDLILLKEVMLVTPGLLPMLRNLQVSTMPGGAAHHEP